MDKANFPAWYPFQDPTTAWNPQPQIVNRYNQDNERCSSPMDVIAPTGSASTTNAAATQPDVSFVVNSTPSTTAPTSTPSLSSSCSGDSNITLWQFLLELLTIGEHPSIIQWTNREGEFKLIDAEAVARLWGQRKGKPHMNYDKLSRALRYYYDKDIIKKVIGQKFVYRFVTFPDAQSNDGAQFALPQVPKLNDGKLNSLIEAVKQEPLRQVKEEVSASPLSVNPALPASVYSQRSNFGNISSMSIPCSQSNGIADTHSPTESSCSPHSVESSSGISSGNPNQTPSSFSRPPSNSSDDCHSRKRKASPPGVIGNGFLRHSSESQPRRHKPQPLNLTETQYLNPTLPFSAISPLNIMQQMSPFLLHQQIQFYALAASASLFGPNSPLFQAAAVATSTNSPFRSPLSTPKAPNAQPIFQFPPVVSSATTLLNPLSGILSTPTFNKNT